MQNYLDELSAEGKSEKTITTYSTVLHKFSEWLEETTGSSDTGKITPMDIKEFKQHLTTILDRKPATTNKYLVAIKGFLEWATDGKLTPTNPARKIPLVEKQQMAPKWLEQTEQYKLIRTVEQERNPFKMARDMAIIQMMLQAGLRVEEVSNLEIKDVTINCKSGQVIVRQGKRGKYREVPLNKDLRDSLKEYLEVRKDHKYGGSNHLFVSERSPNMTTRAIQHLVEEFGYRAKIEGLSCHQLRHSFCHNLILAGTGIEKVAMLAGHASLESTRVYTIPSEKELQIAVEKISFTE
jgi:integrase/recombinase XerC/integrase/recombinase XerD